MPSTRRFDISDAFSDIEDSHEKEQLLRLQRKLRKEELARDGMMKESEEEMRRQEAEMERLSLERNRIMEDLHVASRSQRHNEDKVKDLRNLVLKKTEQDKTIAQDKAELMALDRELTSWQRKLESTRSREWSSPMDIKTKAQRKRKVIENKLDLCFGRLSESLVASGKQRKQIDDFRWNKSLYLRRCERLEEHLTALGEAKNMLLDLSLTTHREREEFNSRTDHIKERNVQNRKLFQVEMQELSRHLDQEDALREFMIAKSKPRSEGKVTRQRVIKEKEEQERQRRLRSATNPSPAELENFFKRLQSKAGVEDIHKVVDVIEDRELEAFASFNYVNELAALEQTLQREVAALEADSEEIGARNASSASQRAADLERLEAEAKRLESDLPIVMSKCEEARVVVNEMLDHVERLLEKLRCVDSSSTTGGAGDSAEAAAASRGNRERLVNSFNLLYFFGVIEERAVQMLKVQRREEELERMTTAGSSPVGLESPKPPAKVTMRRAAGNQDGGGGDGGGISREPTIDDLVRNLDRKMEVVSSSEESTLDETPAANVKPPTLDDRGADDEEDEGFEDATASSTASAEPLNREMLRERALKTIERRRQIEAERAALEDDVMEAAQERYHGGGGGGGGGGGFAFDALTSTIDLLAVTSNYGGKSPRASSRSQYRRSTLSQSHASIEKSSSYQGD